MSSTAKNRFGGIVDATRARQAGEVNELPSEDDTPVAVPNVQPLARPRNGGKGKSSNPDYRHVSSYIRRQTHQAAHRKLLDEGNQRDLSDVIEELLSEWVKTTA